ncbi:serine hydrolase domain-containing protein [Allonocardiopsis opalescens]|uniref:serine hydrolase domain-containing protein n=1 Tax=Allonocardiopsis opalescens TaxID=1144618 RepID=UPI001B80D8D2|nr:serine hydrolase domain-containing protein [Allonocardiopsis opalescens]
MVTLILAGAVAVPATAADPRPAGHGVGAVLQRLVDAEQATAALVRTRDGRHRDAAAFGTADLETGRPARAHGHFRVGSVTKTFVATVVLQLADEGRLGLDDPIERHLPGVVPGGEDISVRQLLNHTSGLYNYTEAMDATYDNMLRPYTPQELLGFAFEHDPYFPPGEGWHYSNTNYAVAGLLIEELTGTPYGEQVERRILRPLGLRHTSVPGDDMTLPRPHARGYEPAPDGGGLRDVTELHPSGAWAAGEMVSTTADLERFLDALMEGRLTSDESLAEMRETVATGVPGNAYGLGVASSDLSCGGEVWGHSGGIFGFVTDASRADDGRQLTLSVNPLPGLEPSTVTELYDAFYC